MISENLGGLLVESFELLKPLQEINVPNDLYFNQAPNNTKLSEVGSVMVNFILVYWAMLRDSYKYQFILNKSRIN
jgi:hypothetical protein